MSDLIIIGYENAEQARKAENRIQDLERQHVVVLTGLAVISADANGHIYVDTHDDIPRRAIATSATAGALWGLVLGMLFLMPVIGLLGAAVGGLAGKLSQSGLDKRFRDRAHELLEPGKAAVVVMTTKLKEDQFAAALQPLGGTVLKTSLSQSDEHELEQQLIGSPQPA
ncbi:MULTISPECIES: DUF1269 domain-containing protein [unclassified Streptomyces]|uniref:DUF1269 domain-containing protein n=1 Tax=unclassified Streptomyces TaxID=2593676 RepID=UPI000C27A883|nr:DUF1269 domain-containing protein [Streptomyces sp. CB02959]PJN36376.1 hypothetical protein CG747_33920 [Streptomyces sp. CB02959]